MMTTTQALLVMHAELVFTLIESDREFAMSEIIVNTNSVTFATSSAAYSRRHGKFIAASAIATTI